MFALATATAAAQRFPSRPILIVVPYGAGSAPDFIARIVADRLAAALGQPVRVENRPGASGTVGAAFVAKSAPDGHTLLVTDNAIVTVTPVVARNESFDATRDLVPVAALVESTVLLVVDASLPVTTLQEFVDYARRANPTLAYATGGVGTGFHLTFEQLKRQAGIDLLHVPYKGPLGAAAVVGGDVSVVMAGKSAQGFLQSGRLRALAVATPVRSDAYPGLPTLDEIYPGVQLQLWQGLFAPAGTPAAVITHLQKEIARILESPEVRKRIAESSDLRPLALSRAQVDERIRVERERNAATVKQLGLTLQ